MFSISSQGTHYELSGSESAPVLILIHGLGLNLQTWDAFVPALAERYRVLRYDLLGHGQSTHPEEPISLSSFSQQLSALITELQLESLNLIGFSLGGMINRRFAMDYPELVNSLVILNSPHQRSEAEQAKVETRAQDSAAEGPGANLDTTINRWFTSEFIRQNPETINQIRDWVMSNAPEVYAQSRMVLAKGVLELIKPTPPLAVPALVMTCENDSGSTPQMSEKIAFEISASHLKIIPSLQHMGLVEQPKLFLEPLLSFLKSTT